MADEPDPRDLEARIQRLDAILEWLGTHPDPEVREATAELAAGIRWLHAVGVERLFELVAEDPERFRRALDDPLVANLLMLYDLVTVDERSRAKTALAGAVEDGVPLADRAIVADIEEGLVTIRVEAGDSVIEDVDALGDELERRLAGTVPGFRGVRISPDPAAAPRPERRAWRGDPVSVVSEERMERIAGKIESIEEDRRNRGGEPDAVGGLVTLGSVPPRLAVCRLDELSEDSLHGHLVEDYPVLVVRTGTEISAFHNACPGSMLPLHLGRLEDGVIVCPWHGCRFESETGEVLGDGRRSLRRLQHRVEDGTLFVRPR